MKELTLKRIAIMGENSIELIEKIIEIWNDGDSVVLIDSKLPVNVICDLLIEANVAICYVEKDLYQSLSDMIPSSIVFYGFERKNVFFEQLPIRIYDNYKNNYSNNEAVIIYSSGTTGKSKGVILSHYSISTNADAIIQYMNISSNDIFGIVKKICYSSTLVGELLVCLKTQTKAIVFYNPFPRNVLEQIEKYEITRIFLNPYLLKLYSKTNVVLNKTLDSLKFIYTSGSVLREDVLKNAELSFKNAKILNLYGLSEAGPRVTAQTTEHCNGTSVGLPIDNVQVSIFSESGDVMDTNKLGIIGIKTCSMFNGYVNNGDDIPSINNEWYNTRDTGYIDENMELHIVGRIDDMITIKGRNVFANDLEFKIMKTFPNEIDDCAVFCVEDELYCAYVSNRNVPKSIKKDLSKVLSKNEIPKYFLRLNHLPRNNNGKVLIGEMKKYWNGKKYE